MIKTWKETYPEYIAERGEKLISNEIENLFSLEKIYSYLTNKNHIIWIAINQHDCAIGYAHLVLLEKNSAFLQQIYLIKKEQGKGIGRMLLNTCYRYLTNKKYQMLELEVDVNNENAIHFYQKQQFTIIKKVPYNNENYYNYLMKKNLIVSQYSFSIWRKREEKLESQNKKMACIIL